MRIGRLRLAYTATMTGLTMIAVTACRWQWRRYHESKDRWSKINESLSRDDPERLERVHYEEMAGLQYFMVKSRGRFGEGQALVMRVKDGRMGFLVVKPFLFEDATIDGMKSVLVNCGWIPEDIEYKGKEVVENKVIGRVV